MRAKTLVLAAITAGALLSSAACGGGTVTIRPADAPAAPTSAAAADSAATAPTDQAGVSIGSDGSVQVGDGTGAGYSIGSDGSVRVDDGTGAGYSIGSDGSVDVRSGVSAASTDGAPDLVEFCTQATRYGIAYADVVAGLKTPATGDAFTSSLATMTVAVDLMRRTGPPALATDLDALATRDAALAGALARNGGDLKRAAADPSFASIDAEGQAAFIRVGVTTAKACP
jgi:hypothetical protein